MSELERTLREGLGDSETGWSMGSFGAIAEFHQDADEPVLVDEPSGLARATARGAIRIDVGRLAQIVPVAYETLSPKPRRWSQAVALCLSEASASRPARRVLTELGPDADAVRPGDREAVLFDMGLGLPQCDFCVRAADPGLTALLREAAGRSLFEHDNPAMPAILAAHPHRVALTNIGRVEVFQKIGGPDTGGVSPPGPHTHLLPKLLRGGRTHSANTPIPDGLLPLGSLHPGNPVIGPMGEDRTFRPHLHHAFQALLSRWGDQTTAAFKARVIEALASAAAPDAITVPDDRRCRAALRLALRQQMRRAEHEDDHRLRQAVSAWLAVFERGAEPDQEDDDAPGH